MPVHLPVGVTDTVTVNEQLEAFSEASHTVYVTLVTPTLNVFVPAKYIPFVGELPVVAPVSFQATLSTLQLSLNTGLGVFTERVQELVEVVVILPGQAITGSILSFTFTIKLVLVVPQLLLALTVTNV